MLLGVLYIVATPIGNINDITLRAVDVLRSVDVIAAEDTRHSRFLLDAHGISTPMISLHEHNEDQRTMAIKSRLISGQSVALISDAGTPLISDPGFRLVREIQSSGLRVESVPGPCAAIAALSVCGLPSDRFMFVGFLPARSTARSEALRELEKEKSTLIFYESPRRVLGLIGAIIERFGGGRPLSIGKELTKHFETVYTRTAAEALAWLEEDPVRQKGEFVIVVQGKDKKTPVEAVSNDAARLLERAVKDLPLKKACELVSDMTGIKKNELYRFAIDKKQREDGV